MKNHYLGLWLLLAISFAVFFVLSAFGKIMIGDIEMENSGMYAELTSLEEPISPKTETLAQVEPEPLADTVVVVEKPKYIVDTLPQRVLFVGDSMLEGLSPRMAAYAKHNGHKLFSIIWYGSTTKSWGNCQRLSEMIQQYKPTFILVSLGGNEMFVKDIKNRHLKPLKNIISQIGDIPYMWIAPPNWKPDTGINELLAENIPADRLFVSKDLKLARASDKVHPTRTAAYGWFDLIVKWMSEHHNYRIKLDKPTIQIAKPDKLQAFAPPK